MLTSVFNFCTCHRYFHFAEILISTLFLKHLDSFTVRFYALNKCYFSFILVTIITGLYGKLQFPAPLNYLFEQKAEKTTTYKDSFQILVIPYQQLLILFLNKIGNQIYLLISSLGTAQDKFIQANLERSCLFVLQQLDLL